MRGTSVNTQTLHDGSENSRHLTISSGKEAKLQATGHTKWRAIFTDFFSSLSAQQI